jgi:hypothetical protein
VSSGEAGAFPHLVSGLARACDDHETDAPRFVLAEVTSGHTLSVYAHLFARAKHALAARSALEAGYATMALGRS